MSQIFDALQRSEAERHGTDAAVVSRATELLQAVERRGSAKRDVDESGGIRDSAVLVEPELPPVEAPCAPGAAAVTDSMTQTGAAQVEEHTGEELTEGPMQCEVLHIATPAGSRLVSLPESESPASEAFHLLGVRLQHMRRQRSFKKLLITSTIPQEGKSMLAANLACTLALRTQQKVLLLEGDVRRPTQSAVFGISNKPGICECLNGQMSLIEGMYRLDGPGIWILPAGVATGNSLESLQSGGLPRMMEKLTSWFDWIVIDSPPILPLADTSVWTNIADAILLVTRQGITQKRQLKRGLEALGTQKLIGVVLNSATTLAHTDYYYRPSAPYQTPKQRMDSGVKL